MTRKTLQLAPGESKPVLKVRFRIQVTIPMVGAPAGVVQVADVLVQAGRTATGWVPHVTEMPWTAGMVGP